MTQQVVRARVTLPSLANGTDNVSNDFIIEATGSDTTLDFVDSTTPQGLIESFYNAPRTTNAVGAYINADISRATNACRIDWYDITAHLDGSPAGSPFRTDMFSLVAAAGGLALPPQCAAVIAVRRDYNTDIEHGVTATLPTDDKAQDEGAPVTHSGLTKPRARDRGRLYLGPLTTACLTGTSGTLSTTFVNDLTAAINACFDTQNSTAHNQFNIVQWSRRNASVNPTRWFYINEAMGTVRRRADVTQSRVHNWVAVT